MYYLDSNSYNDIALVKLDKSIDDVNPICLPEKNFNEIGEIGIVMGSGVILQKSLHTNGGGPDPYTQCAPGAVWEGQKIQHWNEDSNG